MELSATCLIVGEGACADLVAEEVKRSNRFRVIHVSSTPDWSTAVSAALDVEVVVIAVHDDAIGVACAVEAAARWDPGLLIVTLFDQTIGTELKRTLPQCLICSPGEIAAPYLAQRLLAPLEDSQGRRQESAEGFARAPISPDQTSTIRLVSKKARRRARLGLLAGQL